MFSVKKIFAFQHAILHATSGIHARRLNLYIQSAGRGIRRCILRAEFAPQGKS